MNIVKTNISYNSTILEKDLKELKQIYPFIEISTIGKSSLKNPLYCIKLGTGKNKVFYSASYHANEWITSVILMKFIEDYCHNLVTNSKILNKSITDLFNSTSLYIVPMVNPDGVNLVTKLYPYNSPIYNNFKKISLNYPNIPFPNGWKSNFNGVDLNLQFPAKWKKAKSIKYNLGYNAPSPRDFVGNKPLSEPEAKTIYNFTKSHNFSLVIALHTQGKVIYHKFENYNPKNSISLAKTFSQISNYTLEDTPINSSYAGFKDWFIQEFNKPGFTLELGIGTNPLPISQFNTIYNDILGILITGAL